MESPQIHFTGPYPASVKGGLYSVKGGSTFNKGVWLTYVPYKFMYITAAERGVRPNPLNPPCVRACFIATNLVPWEEVYCTWHCIVHSGLHRLVLIIILHISVDIQTHLCFDKLWYGGEHYGYRDLWREAQSVSFTQQGNCSINTQFKHCNINTCHLLARAKCTSEWKLKLLGIFLSQDKRLE